RDQRRFVDTAARAEVIRDPNDSTGLGPAAVHFNFPTGHGFSREGARLEEPRGPEPLIDANLFVAILIVHGSADFITAKKTSAGYYFATACSRSGRPATG